MRQFENKTALVTGASEGIGRATAKILAEGGANLILVARNRERLESLKRELSGTGARIEIHSVDLGDAKAIDALFAQVSELDIAVNNAGTEGKIADFPDLSLEDYDQAFDVNVRSVFLCMKHEITLFRKLKRAGAIVNVSSVLGFRGIAGSSLYVAGKHAVIGFTRAAAVEQIKHGIRVNCVSPGATETPMIRRVLGDASVNFVGVEPSQRLATPAEIAQAITWLCSDQASYLVGHNLVVDGGSTTLP